MTLPTRIADAHVHLWDIGRNAYPWIEARADHGSFLGASAPFRQNFLLPQFRTDVGSCPVEKIVHVQAGMDPAHPVRETQWLQEMADREGAPHAIVGFAPLHRPDVEALLAGHAGFANHRGIRHSVSWHPDPYFSRCDRSDYLTDPQWRRGYALLARHGMSFDLQIFPHQLADAFALGASFPDIPLILDHCAFPIERDPDGMARWRQGMRLMSELPHCTVKLSGLVLVDHRWTHASLAAMVREAVEIFGPSRAMFAGDFPFDRLHIDYRRWMEIVAGAVADLGAVERDEIFYATAVRVYRL
jgi:predicted TIM-barrel fold metal-dependent hydrolase